MITKTSTNKLNVFIFNLVDFILRGEVSRKAAENILLDVVSIVDGAEHHVIVESGKSNMVEACLALIERKIKLQSKE